MKVFGIWFCFEFFVNAEQPNTPFPSVGCTGVGRFFQALSALKTKRMLFAY